MFPNNPQDAAELATASIDRATHLALFAMWRGDEQVMTALAANKSLSLGFAEELEEMGYTVAVPARDRA